MIEAELGKMNEQMSQMKREISDIHSTLKEILSAIKEGNTNPPAPAQVVDMPAKAKSKKAEPVVVEEPEEAKPAAEEKAFTLDDVRDAYLIVQQAHGKDAAIGVIKEIAGDVKNITHVSEDKFAAIIEAFAAVGQKEAA